MRPPEWTAIQATPATSATAPIRATGGGGGNFGDIYQQVRSDVDHFLQHGGGPSSDSGAPASALSLQGQVYLARSQPAADGADSTSMTSSTQQQFLAAIAPMAQEAAQRLGVAPELVAAHAALESGWGQKPVRLKNGADSYNLFGIKAGPGWHGAMTTATTTEYEHGAALAGTEPFRTYPDQASAFRDYAQVLLDNPRYSAALHVGADAHAFAQGLARGGYATDPAYATKLTALATRLQRSAGQIPEGD